MDENKPPLKWFLGRVEQIFTGNDSVGRAVLVKTETGSYKRPRNKLRRLPLYERHNKKDEEEPDPEEPESVPLA